MKNEDSKYYEEKGRKIEDYRKWNTGLTQKALAYKLDITAQSYRLKVHGVTAWKRHEKDVMKALGFDQNWLVKEAGVRA